ncbi:UDP-glucose 6-dehydrogenase [Burkholderia sp. TJI49]|nr:UDP-glucose 6-dehydrogenase [Burkholderia sp. TJI49]
MADRVGADIEAVRRGIGSDPRIGYDFLYAGVGYGGSCFPKDVRALVQTAAAYGRSLRILEAVEAVNDAQKKVLLEKITARFGDDLTGLAFGLWGLAFKPNTDDMREAPSRELVAGLLTRGASVRAYDPVAVDEARRVLALDLGGDPAAHSRLTFVESPEQAVAGADALVIATEWKVFKSPNFAALIELLSEPVIFDGRNLYEPEAMAELGVEYYSIGRPYVAGQRAAKTLRMARG